VTESFGCLTYRTRHESATDKAADTDRHPLKLRDLVVCHLDSENGPEKVVWAAAPEWIINDLPNVGIKPDKYYRPVPLPDIRYLPYTGALMTVDPAGTGTGTDETTYTVTKTLHGLVFLLDAGGNCLPSR
jgi:hypothetical protein